MVAYRLQMDTGTVAVGTCVHPHACMHTTYKTEILCFVLVPLMLPFFLLRACARS